MCHLAAPRSHVIEQGVYTAMFAVVHFLSISFEGISVTSMHSNLYRLRSCR